MLRASSKMRNVAIMLPTGVSPTLVPLFLSRLGQVKNVSFQVVSAVGGKGPSYGAFNNSNRGIFLFDSSTNRLNIVNLKSKMIHTSRITGSSFQKSHTYVAIN